MTRRSDVDQSDRNPESDHRRADEGDAADLAQAENHPLWATEFFAGAAVDQGDGSVAVSVPRMGGPARMRVEADIDQGIVDVFLAPDGAPFGEPLPVRIIPNGNGADVLWTLSRPEGVPEPVWEDGLRSMRRELEGLKKRHEESDIAS